MRFKIQRASRQGGTTRERQHPVLPHQPPCCCEPRLCSCPTSRLIVHHLMLPLRSAGIKAPEVEIRWRGLSAKSTVAVTDKPVPGPLDKLVVRPCCCGTGRIAGRVCVQLQASCAALGASS